MAALSLSVPVPSSRTRFFFFSFYYILISSVMFLKPTEQRTSRFSWIFSKQALPNLSPFLFSFFSLSLIYEMILYTCAWKFKKKKQFVIGNCRTVFNIEMLATVSRRWIFFFFFFLFFFFFFNNPNRKAVGRADFFTFSGPKFKFFSKETDRRLCGINFPLPESRLIQTFALFTCTMSKYCPVSRNLNDYLCA